MKTLIFFREGLSGHYLKSIIDDTVDTMNFRVDPWYPGIYQDQPDELTEDCVCLHPADVDPLEIMPKFDLVLNIQVYDKIYHAIYNNFYKKFLIENPAEQVKFNTWTDDCVYWYDRTYYNIKEYYRLYCQDREVYSFPNTVNFDHLLDHNYVEQLLNQYFNKGMNNNTRRIIAEYSSKQLQIDLTTKSKHMQEIAHSIPDQEFVRSPWFASYCIFKYENNNGLSEHQRCWSIDTLARPIDREFLLSIADQYC